MSTSTRSHSGKIRYWWMWNEKDSCICATSPSDIVLTSIGFGSEYKGKHIKELASALRRGPGGLSFEELLQV